MSVRSHQFRRAACLLCVWTSVAAAQELPKRDGTPEIDLEPKLMLNDFVAGPIPATPPAGGTVSLDVAKLQSDLEKAKKTAVWRDRLCKSGVLSKVEAEQAALKVVRIQSDLESARLQRLIGEAEDQRKPTTEGRLSKEALAASDAALEQARATAAAASARWAEAQRAAAELRLQRERKLLAVGAGSRAAVRRAEASLQTLSAPPSP